MPLSQVHTHAMQMLQLHSCMLHTLLNVMLIHTTGAILCHSHHYSHTAISPCSNCQTLIATTLMNQLFACPHSTVNFTCTTVGGTLAWTSVDYIGDGSLLFIAELANPGDKRNTSFNPSTIATLNKESNNNGQVVMESTLRIVASPRFSTSFVTCENLVTNDAATSNFSVHRK